MALNIDRAIGERILIKNEHGDGCWVTVLDIWEDRYGRKKAKLSIDGDPALFPVTREELLRREDLPL